MTLLFPDTRGLDTGQEKGLQIKRETLLIFSQMFCFPTECFILQTKQSHQKYATFIHPN